MFVMLSIVLVLFVYFGGSMVPKELLKNKELLLGFVVGLVMCSLFKDRLIEGFECINNMQSDRPDVYAFRDIDTSTQELLNTVCDNYVGSLNDPTSVCEKGPADGGVMELCAAACKDGYQNRGRFLYNADGSVQRDSGGRRMRDSRTAPCDWSPERLRCFEAGNTWNTDTNGCTQQEPSTSTSQQITPPTQQITLPTQQNIQQDVSPGGDPLVGRTIPRTCADINADGTQDDNHPCPDGQVLRSRPQDIICGEFGCRDDQCCVPILDPPRNIGPAPSSSTEFCEHTAAELRNDPNSLNYCEMAMSSGPDFEGACNAIHKGVCGHVGAAEGMQQLARYGYGCQWIQPSVDNPSGSCCPVPESTCFGVHEDGSGPGGGDDGH